VRAESGLEIVAGGATAAMKTLYSADFESHILAALVEQPNRIAEIQARLGPTAFFDPKNREIFKAILDLGVDANPASLKHLLQNSSNGVHNRLESIIEKAVTSITAGYNYSVDKVIEFSYQRKTYEILQQHIEALGNGSPLSDIILDAKASLTELLNKFDHDEIGLITGNQLLAAKFDKQNEVISQGILPEHGGMIIAGESGVGKSLIRTELTIHLVMGWQWLGLEIPSSKRVLVVQFENPQATEQYRLRKMLYGLQITNFPNKVMYADPRLRFNLTIKREREQLLNIVKDSGCDVVIYDPLGSLSSADENKNDEMRGVLDTLTNINHNANVSCIVIDHFGKPGPDRTIEHRLRGASSKRDWADCLITISKYRHRHRVLRDVTFVKVRSGPDHKPLLLERDKDTFLHEIVEPEALCPTEKAWEVLRDVFEGECQGQKELVDELCEKTGCKRRTAQAAIKKAVDLGYIIKKGKHRSKKVKYVCK
jgi:hypothetical protein